MNKRNAGVPLLYLKKYVSPSCDLTIDSVLWYNIMIAATISAGIPRSKYRLIFLDEKNRRP